jgi:hypothetical protein
MAIGGLNEVCYVGGSITTGGVIWNNNSSIYGGLYYYWGVYMEQQFVYLNQCLG